MRPKRSLPLIVMFVLSLLATIALLVAWVIYIARSSSRLSR